jgi:hypothetical protein
MNKVIVERPRGGSSWMRTERTALRLSDAQVSEAVARPEDYDSGPRRPGAPRRDKHLNEHLGPLRNFLEGQVGRPWNKVYSEIRGAIDTRSAIGLHVLQHLDNFVTTETAIEDGRVVGANWFGRVEPVRGLYVHPLTGILRRSKPVPRSRRSNARPDETELNFVRLSETLAYEKLNGCWFRLEYRINDPAEAAEAGPRTLIDKRQCDRKTVRRIEAGDFGVVTNKGYFYRTTAWPR